MAAGVVRDLLTSPPPRQTEGHAETGAMRWSTSARALSLRKYIDVVPMWDRRGGKVAVCSAPVHHKKPTATYLAGAGESGVGGAGGRGRHSRANQRGNTRGRTHPPAAKESPACPRKGREGDTSTRVFEATMALRGWRGRGGRGEGGLLLEWVRDGG